MSRPTPATLAAPVRSDVRAALEAALADAIAARRLPELPAEAASPPDVARPANPEHGDYASNLALKLARPLRRPPLAIAEAVVESLRSASPDGLPAGGGLFVSVEVAPPGFINLTLSPRWLERRLDAARIAGPDFGRLRAADPRHVNVEFVSANPTGPLHIGNARGAFVGDLLCRVLEGGGHQVTREYYFNDSGTQVDHLGASVLALREGREVPEDGYKGDYVADLARELPGDVLAAATAPGAQAARVVGRWASERVREGIEASLARLGVRFDVWRTEGTLHSEGWVERAVERLRAGGHIYEQDGATWFRSTALGDDKDRVVYRSDGRPTYFAADIGYLVDKFERGFDELVYIWGADHHGTVARVRNAAEAMGYDKARVRMLLVAWVRFVRDGREISMSKRSGEFITLDELLAEVGVDAARWFFASRAASTGIDFDIELAKRQSNENPVYYVQYAHARIASILRKAKATGISAAESLGGLLDDEVALGMAKAVLRLPEVVEDAAASEETQGLTAYATELATTFHAFYRDRRVVDADDPATSARRLALVDAVRLSLANTLALLGISAPESM
ncbi:MAG TPA: arginine--tRNA ligase [Candidatus Limnocylindrales bacterium]|nr:arginine--tRNA ligase [Candidatus Limnocylindrales bacterium]